MGRHTAAAVLSTFWEDLNWLNEMPWSDNISVIVHDRRERRTRLHDTAKVYDSMVGAEASEEKVKSYNSRRTHPIDFLHVPNVGDEAGSYLGWIIHNWDRLPDVTFFLHGHRCSSHADFDMSVALPNMRQCFEPQKGYLDINSYRIGQDTQCQSTKKLIEKPLFNLNIERLPSIWRDLFEQEFGPMPDRFCWDSFGQFAVSRSAIQRHPKSFYESLLKGVVRHNTTMEFFWRTVFAKDPLVREPSVPKDRNGNRNIR